MDGDRMLVASSDSNIGELDRTRRS